MLLAISQDLAISSHGLSDSFRLWSTLSSAFALMMAWPLWLIGRSLRQRSTNLAPDKPTALDELSSLPAGSYRVFDHLKVPRLNGMGQSHLHHVVVSAFGIFVIHCEERRGEIVGSDEDYHWQSGASGNPRHFVNPLVRNAYHSRCLARVLKITESWVLPLVYYSKSCRFSHAHAPNLVTGSLVQSIECHKQPLIDLAQLADIIEAMQGLDGSKQQPSGFLSAETILSMQRKKRLRIGRTHSNPLTTHEASGQMR